MEEAGGMTMLRRGLDVEVSGDRELKVTEEGSEEVFGGCCFACLMYQSI